MGKESVVSRPFTRALASALRASTTQNQQRANTNKRPASEDKDVTAAPNKKKKREVLEDISNVTLNAPKLEVVQKFICVNAFLPVISVKILYK